MPIQCVGASCRGADIRTKRIRRTYPEPEPIDVGRYGLIYVGAQKNLGPSGLPVVVIREDLAKQGADSLPALPTMLRYATHVADRSLYNTPPVFGIYILRLVLKWLVANGGLEAMAAANERKAGKLYARDRPHRLLPRPRRSGQPVADERDLPSALRGSRNGHPYTATLRPDG